MRKTALVAFIILMASQAITQAQTHKAEARIGLVYFPTGSVKMPSSIDKLTFYDSFAYKLGAAYSVSEYLSIGPGIEYLNKKVNPDATFSAKINVVSILADARFSYPMTDSGSSNFVLGLGTGLCRLSEKGSGSENGPSIYATIGFDIGVGTNMGMDLLYRYGFSRVDLENVREYRFDSWALQTGINYRFKL